MKKNRIKGVIENPKKIILFAASKGCFKVIPDKTYLKILYYAYLGKKLNINNPRTFNEKLQKLKLCNRKKEYTTYVDKYAVRKHITEMIGEEHLIDLLGVYDKFEDIDFDTLPNQFVLKCTHDCGGNVICKDKEQLDIEAAKKKISRCLKRNYYYHGREFPYKNVKPRIICEKYMVDQSGAELKDYKFMCFNGEVKCLFICLNRNSETGLNIDIYDTEWNLMPFQRPNHPNSGTVIPKPKNFDRMVKFAEKLSKDIPFVRVDFYEIDSKLYFGELTFFPGSGYEEFTPESYDYLLGSWIELPSKICK